MTELVDLILEHQWVAVGAIVIGGLVRLVKSQWFAQHVTFVPPGWRPWIALGLGAVHGVLQHLAAGVDPRRAIVEGIVAAGVAILGHEFLVESLRGGRELGGA